ncbi:hypothetical protein GCK32_005973 [Trichostrongylus colubriformis]|uniref:Uncharacterized protein n=1 Tax=Trichostrongylus colubriformis TaxID=6319 RepID=A0AAN8G1N7_TRICO
MFSFPIIVLRNGGYFFLIIHFLFAFFISFPILHLELFVSQHLHCGIVKSFRLYGYGYTGIGISILLLTVANQNQAIHNGYYLLSHLTKLSDGVRPIVDCILSSYIDNRTECESLFNNQLCADQSMGNLFLNGACTNVTGSGDILFERGRDVQTTVITYVKKFMKDTQEHVNYAIVVFEYAFLFFCACIGAKGLRIVLISVYVFVVIFFITMMWNMPPLAEVLSILWMSTNPVFLFRMETYLSAFRMSVQTYGLCVFGIFCLSSFRNRNGRSYQTTMMVFWLMMITSGFALLTIMIMMLKANDLDFKYVSTRTSISTNLEGIRFAVAAMTEYASLVSKKPENWLYLYYILFLMMDLTSVFGGIFVIYALIRDFCPRFGRIHERLVVFAYFSIQCFFYVFVTIRFADGEKTMGASVVSFSKYILICAEILVFVHSHGVHEFEIDVVDALGERGGQWNCSNPTSLMSAYYYSLIALVAMQAIESNRLNGWLQFRSLYDQVPEVVDPQTMTKFVASLIPLILPLVICFFLLSCAPRDMEISELFSVTEAHPAFKRVKGAFLAQEMIGDHLLDRTPPDERTELSAPSEEKKSGSDKGKKDVEEHTAPSGMDSTEISETTAKESREKTQSAPKTALAVSARRDRSKTGTHQGVDQETQEDLDTTP